jgi:hypothetical protein
MQIQHSLNSYSNIYDLGTEAKGLSLEDSRSMPPNREKFIQAVHKFEEEHQLKLEDFIVGKAWIRNKNCITEEQANYRTAFFSEPIIQGYLSRGSEFVPFLENRPALISDETKPDVSDYYECKIYELAAKDNAMFLPYRNHVMTDLFYESMTTDPSIFRNIQSKSTTNYKVTKKGFDIYEIRDLLRRVEFGKYSDRIEKEYKGIKFILSPIGKDGHAMTIISVIQKKTFKHLTSIFINSFDRKDHYKFISDKFNLRTNQTHSLLEGKDCEKFFKITAEKLCGKSTFIDLGRREGYLVDPSYGINPTLEEAPVFKALENQTIDLIHTLNESNDGTLWYGLYGSRNVPLIDASHSLQTQEKDENCAIYSLNFLQGIAHLLENEGTAKKVYQLAEQIDSGSAIEKESAKKTMATIFSRDLRQYIPAYYNAEGIQKSDADIKKHHLYQRWDLGSQGMQPEFLRESGYLPKNKF